MTGEKLGTKLWEKRQPRTKPIRTALFLNGRLGEVTARALKNIRTIQAQFVVVHDHPGGADPADDVLAALPGGPIQQPSCAVVRHSDFHSDPMSYMLNMDGESTVDLILSAGYGYRIPARVLSLAPLAAVNLHTGLLPYGRGMYPNIWPIIEGTPAGVTIHQMTDDIDSGFIFAQEQVPYSITTDGSELDSHLKGRASQMIEKFLEDLCTAWTSGEAWSPAPAEIDWGKVADGSGMIFSMPDRDKGRLHKREDAVWVDRLEWDAQYRLGDLLNRLRARTYRGHESCYFIHPITGRKVYVRVMLEAERDG